MRGRVFLAIIVFLGVCNVAGQVGPSPADLAREEQQRRRNELDVQRRMSDLHLLEQQLRIANRKARVLAPEPTLLGEAKARVLRLRRVSSDDASRYSEFLKLPNSGLIKLFPDLGCSSKNVIRVSADCERFVPLSSAFKFRTNSYADNIYHDVKFANDELSSDSFFSQGILTSLGDEPIENITGQHPALKFLTEYQPGVNVKDAASQARNFHTGVSSGGYLYSDRLRPTEQHTYALRFIGYRLENGLPPISDETSMDEMMFHSLAYDKRVDLLIIFRVLSRDEYQGITLVWRELQRIDPPKIKFAKNQQLKDFRPERK